VDRLPGHPTHRTKTVKPRLPTFPGFERLGNLKGVFECVE
jgi:hypothetical protein